MLIAAGVIAAIVIVALGAATRQHRDAGFYCTVLVVIALVYVLFAVMDGRGDVVVAESAIAAAFVGAAVAGTWTRSARAGGLVLAVGLILHGGYDLVHDRLLDNRAAPEWWPVFCGVIDIVLGAWVGWLAATNRLTRTSQPSD